MIIEKALPPPPPLPLLPVAVQTNRAAEVGPPPSYNIATFRDFPSHPPPSTPDSESDIHSVNHLHIHNRRKDVIGTYCIDPTMPMPHKFKGKSKWKASSKTPNASFRTLNRGTIAINLATKGTTTVNSKAYVRASAHKGDISINIYSLQRGKHIHLDASSRKGHVLILIPRSFCGAIQLNSRKDGCKILPALSSVSRVLKTTDRDTLILVGDPSSVSASPDTADDLSTDFCQLRSRSGKVTVGFSGEDKYVPTETSVWQKVGEFFGRRT
ncbi:hypothetical protein PILCRDRAFT_812256 [Piloderma croceum F 1598]|uniref:DUF7330 domain-containing protein n=1 Tax=Piloderma croceum (strain F 1598) TaxID=765440 RepID=A0A0C3BVD1_PILCF|nr:hypothetical protein PILCRDRAFT_812256 [Piloderma croceum F 1598]